MQNKANELDTKKTDSKLSKSKKILHADQVISPEKEFDRQRMIETAKYTSPGQGLRFLKKLEAQG